MTECHKIGFVIFASTVSQHLYVMYFCSRCDVPIFFTLNTQRMLSEICFSELCPSIIIPSFRWRPTSFIVQSFFFLFLMFVTISVGVCCDTSANFANFLMWNRRHKNPSQKEYRWRRSLSLECATQSHDRGHHQVDLCFSAFFCRIISFRK